MLASTFYAQPLGYLTAAIISIIVLASYQDVLPSDIKDRTCNHDCRQALDRSWRIIIGIGAIFAIIAFWFRRTIPESPRYTAFVLGRPDDASEDVDLFFGIVSRRPRATPSRPSPNTNAPPPPHLAEQDLMSAADSGEKYNVTVAAHSGSGSSSQNVPPEMPSPAAMVNEDTIAPNVPAVADGETSSSRRASSITSATSIDEQGSDFPRMRAYLRDFAKHLGAPHGRWRVLAAISIAWFCLDAAYYALIGASASKIATKIFDVLPVDYNCTAFLYSTLGSTPNCTLLDLGASNPRPQTIFGSVFDNLWRVIILVCAGSVPAGAGMIYLVEKRSLRLIQAIGFFALAFILIIAGVILRCVDAPQMTAATIPFYILAQIFFEIGPNFTTWMLAAELFPTKHRALSHGIAAASGKLGAVLFQVFFQTAKYPGGLGVDDPGTNWLGLAIICFMPFMLIGGFVTLAWIPETRDRNGKARSLEKLEKQMRSRKKGDFDIEASQPDATELETVPSSY